MYSEGFRPPFELRVNQNLPRRKRYVTANQNTLSANPVCIGVRRFMDESTIYRTTVRSCSVPLPYTVIFPGPATVGASSNSARQIVLGIQLQPRRLKWFVTLLDFFCAWRHAVPVWYQLEVKISPATQCVVWIPLVPSQVTGSQKSIPKPLRSLEVDEFSVQLELSVHPFRPTPPRHLHLSGGDLRLDTATDYIQSFGCKRKG
ncbi:hypothetical protein EV359DRAFT_60079 [Lentinula novae-zelandiae]|nr:hypothetical protein EV359DRAFT_60079 [Lentinula novae-zelandiae]